MNIESMVRDALSSAEPDTGALTRLTALAADLVGDDTAGKSGRRRRRILAPVLAAAAVVVTVSGGTLLAAHWPGADRPPADSGPAPLTAQELRPIWKFSVGHVPGYTIIRTSIMRYHSPSDEAQAASITAGSMHPGPRGIFVLTMTPSDFRDAAKGMSRPTTVGSYSGLFFPGQHVGTSELESMDAWDAAYAVPDLMPRLMWKYPDGSFGSIIGTFGFDPKTYDYDNGAALATLRKIALSIRTDVDDPVRIPFELKNLPSHLVPDSVDAARPCLGYGRGESSGTDDYMGDWVGSVMSVCRVHTGASRAATLAEARIIEGETASTTVRDLPDGTSLIVEVDQGEGGLVSAKQAERLAATADVAPRLDDPSSWLVVK